MKLKTLLPRTSEIGENKLGRWGGGAWWWLARYTVVGGLGWYCVWLSKVTRRSVMHAFSTISNWHTGAEFERTSLISSKFATSIGAPKKNFTFSRRVKACILTKTVCGLRHGRGAKCDPQPRDAGKRNIGVLKT